VQVRKDDQKGAPLFVVSIVLTALAVNCLLSIINEGLALPFFFDSIGTAIAAVTVGLVPALVVAVGTNALFELIYEGGGVHIPFAICGIATVLILRAFRRSGNFTTIGNALFASLAVALANAVLGGMIAAFVFGGITGVGIDFLVAGLVAGGRSVLSASFWARVPANLIDKTIAVFVAFFLQGPLRTLGDRLSARQLPQ
jgi:energy-coupling factor transport system substrate-specific component